MSEYETASFAILQIMGQQLVQLGANRDALEQRLREQHDATLAMGDKDGAAMFDWFIRSLSY